MTEDCARVWQAVLHQALCDLTVHIPNNTGAGAGRKLRRDAESFLTATGGEWARHREFVCDLAGADAGKVRATALELIRDRNRGREPRRRQRHVVGGPRPAKTYDKAA